jgi:glycosyltransferase involved in cell wall biosynthesis/SAM-dependent methyltransferase
MVKNEQDIIEPFVRHNLAFVDSMIVMDNGSDDETRRILAELMRELPGLVVTDDPAFGYNQAERMARMLAAAQSVYRADYVLFLDADEFIDAPSRAEFGAALTKIPAGGLGLVPWRTFVLPSTGTAAAQRDVPRTMAWRRSAERPQFHKAILRLDGAFQPDLRPLQGNHDVGTSSGRELARVELPGIFLAHFPLRQRDQLIAKVTIGWLAYLAIRPNAREGDVNYQWRELFDRFCAGNPIGDDELSRFSRDYAQQADAAPPPPNEILPAAPPRRYQRKYSTGAFADPLRLVVRAWERTLAASRPIVSLTRPETPAASAPEATAHWDELSIDVPPIRYAIEKWQPISVLDIGCGIGGYVALVKALGTRTSLGLDELAPEATALGPEEYRSCELAAPLDLGERFDLVLCLDAAGRVPPGRTQILCDNLARHAGDRIIFTAPEIGQPGDRFIQRRSLADWLALWNEQGWAPELAPTLAMRAVATVSALRRNLVVLRRGNQRDETAATERLLELASADFAWLPQPPGIWEYAFTELPGEA